MAEDTSTQNAREKNNFVVVLHSLDGGQKIFHHVEYCTLDTVSGRIQVLPYHARMSTILQQGNIVIKGVLQNTKGEDALNSHTSSGHKVSEDKKLLQEYSFENIDALVKISPTRVDIFVL